MKLEEVKTQKTPKPKKPTVAMTIRVTEHLSAWLTTNQASPTAIFLKAVEELGYKAPQ